MGVYDNGILVDEASSEEKTSDALPLLMKDLLKKYTCKKLYYAKGPGSFMAIKVSYIFLKTLSISLKVPFFACDIFEVNGGLPVKAFGKNFFVKENGNIVLKQLDKNIDKNINLPKDLANINFSEDSEPLYVLPAV